MPSLGQRAGGIVVRGLRPGVLKDAHRVSPSTYSGRLGGVVLRGVGPLVRAMGSDYRRRQRAPKTTARTTRASSTIANPSFRAAVHRAGAEKAEQRRCVAVDAVGRVTSGAGIALVALEVSRAAVDPGGRTRAVG